MFNLLKNRESFIFVLMMASLFVFISPAFSQETVLPPEADSKEDTAGTESEDSDQSRGIVAGEVDPGHPEVGKILSGYRRCTGTLIGTRTVLTAAHCAEDGDSVEFEIGGQVYSGTFDSHPNYVETDERPVANDLAVVTLEHDVPGVMPKPLCAASPTLDEMPMIIVGYGRTSSETDDYGTKKWGFNYITSSTTTHTDSELLGSQVCSGDSGGPAFIPETDMNGECVIGVASTGNCTYSMTHVRPDGHSDWIDEAVGGDDTVDWIQPCYDNKCNWGCFIDNNGNKKCGWY